MSAKSRLRQALDAVENAQRILKRIQSDPDAENQIRRAIRELDDAASEIERAIRNIPEE